MCQDFKSDTKYHNFIQVHTTEAKRNRRKTMNLLYEEIMHEMIFEKVYCESFSKINSELLTKFVRRKRMQGLLLMNSIVKTYIELITTRCEFDNMLKSSSSLLSSSFRLSNYLTVVRLKKKKIWHNLLIASADGSVQKML